jgi:DnaK suppressor protein
MHMTNTPTRYAALRQILTEREREMRGDIRERIRGGRAERSIDVSDVVEQSDAGIQGDISLAVLQMNAETLNRIEEALVRLDAGQYGTCFECSTDIAEARLRALPFAVRCRACEGAREARRSQRKTGASGVFSLFPDLAGS